MEGLKLSPKEQELKDKFEISRAYLKETNQIIFDGETLVRLINLIVEDICQRLIKIKEAVWLDKNLNKREIEKLYFDFTTSLDEDMDDEEGDRIMRAMFGFWKTGDFTMWDFAYSHQMNVFPAGLILYLRYYAAKGFNVLSYSEDLRFMNKIERTLKKLAERYLYDETVDVLQFKEILDQNVEKVKLFYGRRWI